MIKSCFAALFCVLSILASAVEDPIRIWPRQEPVELPAQLEQFLYLEMPVPAQKAPGKLLVTFPEGVEIIALPRGEAPTMPARSRSLQPVAHELRGHRASFTLAASSYPDRPYAFLPLTIRPGINPGKYTIRTERQFGNETIKQDIPLIVHPPLAGRQPRKIAVIAYDYPGLSPEALPTYLGMMKSAGINRLDHMRGEPPQTITATDRGAAYGIASGLVFFIHQVQDFYAKRPLPAGAPAGLDVKSLSALLDQPATFKPMIHAFLVQAMDGKPYTTVIYDAERGGFFGGKVGGDRSAYGLASFRKFAGLSDTVQLTDEELATTYRQAWTEYNCRLTERVAKLLREVLDELNPDLGFEVYSGYQFDSGAQKNRTRELYGVDWAKLADAGFDRAVAGYFGSPAQIRHTAEAVRGRAGFTPAEMYVEHFNRQQSVTRRPGPWSVRLLRSYLAGDRQAIALWYANVMDGNALVAVDRLTRLLTRSEEILSQGKLDATGIRIRPETEKDNAVVLRLGGNTLILLLNSDDHDKKIRVMLDGFNLTGFSGALAVSDVLSGEKIPPAKVLNLTVPAGSFRAVEIFDDGN